MRVVAGSRPATWQKVPRRGRGGTFQPRAPSHTRPHSDNLLSAPPGKRPKCQLQWSTRHFARNPARLMMGSRHRLREKSRAKVRFRSGTFSLTVLRPFLLVAGVRLSSKLELRLTKAKPRPSSTGTPNTFADGASRQQHRPDSPQRPIVPGGAYFRKECRGALSLSKPSGAPQPHLRFAWEHVGADMRKYAYLR